MKDTNVNITYRFPVLNLLGMVLVILKALGYITWEWWIVLLPFIPSAIGIAIILTLLAIAAACGLFVLIVEAFQK
jgi:hypothetical protein